MSLKRIKMKIKAKVMTCTHLCKRCRQLLVLHNSESFDLTDLHEDVDYCQQQEVDGELFHLMLLRPTM